MDLGYLSMTFTPSGKLNSIEFHNMSLKGLPNITKIRSDKDEQKIAEIAQTCIADFFAVINRIELADPETEKLSSVPYNIKRYDNGMVKSACVRFSLEPVK